MSTKHTPVSAAKHWRNSEQKEESLDSFLLWLEYDYRNGMAHAAFITEIKALIDEYLGRDMEKIKQGESLLLEQWIEATK
jgi:hypothetical protein